MKRILLIFLPLVIVAIFVVFNDTKSVNTIISKENPRPESTKDDTRLAVLATMLDTPWSIAFLPASPSQVRPDLLVAERGGTVRLITPDSNTVIATVSSVQEIGEGGLLGLALHPKFSQNNHVYLYYTYGESRGNTRNRIVRMTYQNKTLSNERILLDNIPSNFNHNGGRIKFGPDGYLYATTGDAENPSQSQNTKSLAGKILRIKDDGGIPSDNPFGNPVYSYGHRNPQGITWDENGNLWETEHGRSGITSGLDEVNLIKKGANYGWPTIQGDQVRSGMVTPIRNSGAATTWAPAGLAYLDSTLYFGGLRGQSLYEVKLSGTSVTSFRELLKGELGRIRDVVVGPDNALYITTSNKDGRGEPAENDDRIIRVNLKNL